MKNLIKIIATMTALGTMTACGASGLADNLAQLVDDGLKSLQALRLEAAARQIRTEELAEFRENLDTNLTDQQREDMVAAEATRLANLSGTEKTEFDARVQTRVTYLAEVAGLTASQRAANLDRCQTDATGDGCAVVLLTFCDDTPFDNFCFSDPAYDDRRVEICEVDSVRNNCEDTIFRVCAANPFITLCAGDDRYDTVRAVRCAVDDTEKASPRCEATVKRVCDLDVEDSLCDLIPAYTSQRLTLDSTRLEIVSRGCGNSNRAGDGRCAEIIRFVCEREPLDTICDVRGEYRPARVALCLADDNRADDDNPCATTISQVCPSSPLDDLCVGIALYAPLQESSCRGESATSKPECATTLTRVCGNLAGTSATGDPFGPVCSNDVFQPARDAIGIACAGDITGRLCTSQRNELCGNTPFNDVCKRSEYLYLQIRACIGQPATGNCADTTFFTDPVILSCLTNPFATACTNDNSAFKPYETDALDATCLLAASGTRAGCANPTAVFGTTLPTRPTQVLTNPSQPFDATTNPYTDGIFADPTQPYDASTNKYVGGFIRLDSTILNDSTGDLDRAKIEGISNFLPESIGLANPVTLRRDSGADDNSDSDDGIAYFYGFDDDDLALSYGGILPTTNLGAPLVAPVGNEDTWATWDGHFRYRQTADVPLKVQKFYVDFDKGTINFANAAGDGPSKITESIFDQSTDMELHGTFGPKAARKTFTYDTSQPNNVRETTTPITLTPGELGGNLYLYYSVPDSNQNNDKDPDNVIRFNLAVQGLIGQEGVVGVFLDAGSRANTRVGGFTASNPDHPNNQ